jgi:hypothetical protein
VTSEPPERGLDVRYRQAQDAAMAGVAPLPVNGVVCLDQRDAGRALRLSWHYELGSVVLSIWRNDVCVATSQVATEDVPALVNALVAGLAQAPTGQAGNRRLA